MTDAPDPLLGRTIGDFRIDAPMGVGSVGRVYSAVQVSLGRSVALKVLEEGLFTLEEDKARFLREASILAALEHPNILPVYASGVDQGVHFLATRLVPERTTLADRMAEGLPLAEGIRISADLCSALACAHARGIVHRDVKPENVLLAEGMPLLADFGLAHADAGAALTATGAAVGTPLYWSPEQARGERATPQSDLFALGVFLYQVATGRHPFAGEGGDLRGRISACAPAPPRTLRPELPERVEPVILRALAREPAARFASADEMRRELRTLLALPGIEGIAALPCGSPAPRSLAPTVPSLPRPVAPSTPSPSLPSAPRPFGKYLLGGPLGHGGMGIVYRAEQPELGRTVALKVLRGDGDDPRAVERFLRESRAAAKLHHPGIVPIHEVGEIDGRHYFTMDWIVGEDLEALVARGPAPTRRAIEIVRDVARAVQHAHEQGIVHRDLKPANVLVESGGRVLVTDFGLAKDLELSDRRLSLTGEVMGTPAYMAPEQARGESTAIGPRSDVYALGAVLYHLLTGRAPYAGDGLADILVAVMLADPPAPRALNPKLPADAETICRKAMAREPDRRYATAAELADDCERFLKGEPIRARPPSVAYRLTRWVIRRRGMVAIAVAAALLLSLALGLLVPELQRRRQELARRDALKPLEDAIRDARPYSYVTGSDVIAKLKIVEESIARLAVLLRASDLAADPAVWTTLGLGRRFVGDDPGAEAAFLEARRLGSTDPQVPFELGRIYLDRSLVRFLGRRRGMTSGWAAEIDPGYQEARRWIAEACAVQAPAGSATERVDPRLSEAYLALVEGRRDEAAQRCREGISATGDRMGVEEYWNLLGLASPGAERLRAYDQALARRPHYAWVRLMRGMDRRSSGDRAGAREDLDAALALQPRLVSALIERGLVRAETGDEPGALLDYGEALRLDPDSANAHYNRAAVRHHQGDSQGAFQDLEEAIRLDPRFASPLRSRGNLKRERGDLGGARADYDAALALDPADADALVDRATLRLEQKDRSGARADLDAALAIDRTHVTALIDRSSMRREEKDAAGARADAEAALKIDPHQALALVCRGLARGDLGDPAGARADLDEALRIDPSLLFARLHRSALELAAGDLAAALADLDEAVRRHPESAEAHHHRGYALTVKGDLDGAIAEYDATLRLKPGSVDVLHSRGAARMGKAQYDLAIADFTAVLRLQPRHATALYNRGMCHLARGEADAAVADWDAALAIRPDYAWALYYRGSVRQDRGDLAAALADYESAIRAAPRVPEAYLGRGSVRIAQGDSAGGKADLEKVLEIAPPDSPLRAQAQALLAKLGDGGGR